MRSIILSTIILTLLPGVVLADLTATLDTINPTAIDVTNEFLAKHPPAPAGVVMYAFRGSGNLGERYTALFDVSEFPATVVTVGARPVSVSFNPMDSKLRVIFDYAALKLSDDQKNEDFSYNSLFLIGLEGAAGPGELGPPQAARGMFMGTNVLEWQLIPPTSDNPKFGFQLSGPQDDTAFFRMFIPNTLIDHLSGLAGETISASELAVYDGDDQASLAVFDTGDGALLDVNVVFSDSAIDVSDSGNLDLSSFNTLAASSGTVSALSITKTVSTGKASSFSVISKEKEFTSKSSTLTIKAMTTQSTSSVTKFYQKRKRQSTGTKYWKKVSAEDSDVSDDGEASMTITAKKCHSNKKCQFRASISGVGKQKVSVSKSSD
ncbi:MAG: hypothetical protein H6619_04950 [Deltaproteobacteria bacterium]|nr:hypothetical protein [Deltaproteobacteria bacterium]